MTSDVTLNGITYSNVQQVYYEANGAKHLLASLVVNGVEQWKRDYTWKKYSSVAEENLTTTFARTSISAYKAAQAAIAANISCATDYITTSTDYMKLSGTIKSDIAASSASNDYPYIKFTDTITGTGESMNFLSDSINQNLVYKYASYSQSEGLYVYAPSNTVTTNYTQGNYITDVTSTDESAYPENGRHTDGYWYVKQ